MTIEQAREQAHERGHELLEPAKKKNTYICPICKNGTGEKGDGISEVPNKKGKYKCFGTCGTYGDIYDFTRVAEGLDKNEAYRVVNERLGIRVDFEKQDSYRPSTQRNTKPPQNYYEEPPQYYEEEPQQKPLETPPQDFVDFYMISKGRLQESPQAMLYLRNRGFSEAVIDEYLLGFDGRNIVFPYSRNGYLLRGIDSNFKGNGTGSKKTPFNLKSLNQKEPVFIVEGEFDALSIIEAGGQAIGLGSISMIPFLLEHLKSLQNAPHLILCLDNDKGGIVAQERLVDGLNGQGRGFSVADLCRNHKDPNEALVKERDSFLQEVSRVLDKAKRPDNMTDYLATTFNEDVRIFNKGAGRKTMYKNLDAQIGGLYTGLYVLGAISSLGKTTFVHQMADQLAENGEHVLYFSLEQSRMELLSKSLSRATIGIGREVGLSGIQIRQGQSNEALEDSKLYYTDSIAPKMSIIESNFNCTVKSIKEKVLQYKANNPDTFPVVIIDYLQILQPDEELQRATTKEITDYNVTELKRLSRDENVVVIAISSVNRSNYLSPIDFESFKESGGIEFTADVIWGLQLEVLGDDLFSSEKKTVEKRKLVMEAKAKSVRDIELVCLKNRFGISSYTLKFEYLPQFDYFKAKG